MKQEHKEQLVFLGLCLSSNISKCVAEESRKHQVLQSQNQVIKLLHFLGIELTNLEDVEYVVAFRFKKPKLDTHIYHHSLGILDEKFLFWLSDLIEGSS